MNRVSGPNALSIVPGDFVALFAGGRWRRHRAARRPVELARWQLTGQIVLALGAAILGISVGVVNNPFGAGVIRFLPAFSVGFTVFWIVGMINSINFIDGLDGLSTGVALIASVTSASSPDDARPSAARRGAVLRARGGAARLPALEFPSGAIFSGTTGSMFVGYTLAVLSILGTAKVAVALLVLGVPIIDTFWIIVHRGHAGRSPFRPDRGHIHHRLLDLGLSHTQTVLFIYALCGGLAVLSLVLSGAGQLYAFVLWSCLSGSSCSCLRAASPAKGLRRRLRSPNGSARTTASLSVRGGGHGATPDLAPPMRSPPGPVAAGGVPVAPPRLAQDGPRSAAG